MLARRTFLPIVLGLLAALLFVASCARGPADEARTTPQPGAPLDEISAAATLSAITNGSQDGGQARDFTLKSIDGADIGLSDLRGSGVIIAFWATWCNYCREELSLVADVYHELHDAGLEVLAVNVSDRPESVLALVSELRLPYPVLMDPDGIVADLYRVRGLPTTVFVDPEGVVQRVQLGTMDEDTLRFFAGTVLPDQG